MTKHKEGTVGEAIHAHMLAIAAILPAGVRVTFIARMPGNTLLDTIYSSDEMPELVKLLERAIAMNSVNMERAH